MGLGPVLRGSSDVGIRPRTRLDEKGSHADDTTAHPQAAPEAGQAEQSAGDAILPAEAGGLYARLYHDAEEAELRLAQGRPRPSHQSDGSDELHPRRGT